MNIGLNDSNEIKALPPLCTSIETNFFKIKTNGLQDMYGNAIFSTAIIIVPLIYKHT